MQRVQRLAKRPETVRTFLRGSLDKITLASLKAASREQGLDAYMVRLAGIVSDITDQYTTFRVNTEIMNYKVRLLHAFQIRLVEQALNRIKDIKTIVDIGDSSGAHLQYIRSLFGRYNTISVNLDPIAVKKIHDKGLNAVLGRAEELHTLGIKADLYLCLETLEHLFDPVSFLKKLSTTGCQGFVVTVPYVAKSQVGLHHLRYDQKVNLCAENTHIFELSPDDWRLLFRFSGWRVSYDDILYQYPRRHPLRLTKTIWRSRDFEGFYGAVLIPDNTWSKLYQW